MDGIQKCYNVPAYTEGCPDSAEEAFVKLESKLSQTDKTTLNDRGLIVERSSDYLWRTETITVSRDLGAGYAFESYRFIRDVSFSGDVTYEAEAFNRDSGDWEPLSLSARMYFGVHNGYNFNMSMDLESLFGARNRYECP